MNRSSVIPTQRSRWPLAYGVLLMLAGISIVSAAVQALVSQPEPQADVQAVALQGYDQGYADAMNQVADTVGDAYSTGYRTAQREAAAACNTPRQEAPL